MRYVCERKSGAVARALRGGSVRCAAGRIPGHRWPSLARYPLAQAAAPARPSHRRRCRHPHAAPAPVPVAMVVSQGCESRSSPAALESRPCSPRGTGGAARRRRTSWTALALPVGATCPTATGVLPASSSRRLIEQLVRPTHQRREHRHHDVDELRQTTPTAGLAAR